MSVTKKDKLIKHFENFKMFTSVKSTNINYIIDYLIIHEKTGNFLNKNLYIKIYYQNTSNNNKQVGLFVQFALLPVCIQLKISHHKSTSVFLVPKLNILHAVRHHIVIIMLLLLPGIFQLFETCIQTHARQDISGK